MIQKDAAYRADADAWMAMLHGLTPSDEAVFLDRLAKLSGRGIDDVRGQWEKMGIDGGGDVAIRRVKRFFRKRVDSTGAA